MAKEAKKVEGAPDGAPDQDDAGSPEIRVKASLPRRYRVGRAFGLEPVTIPAGELSEEDYRLILADPYLAVTEIGGRSTGS